MKLGSARRGTAALFVALGVVIVIRGLIEAAPFSFTLMGGLMIALGVYRLRPRSAGSR
ncbi:MAG: hypothetical protein ACRDIY_16930 [Chloroflexota bacterium]